MEWSISLGWFSQFPQTYIATPNAQRRYFCDRSPHKTPFRLFPSAVWVRKTNSSPESHLPRGDSPFADFVVDQAIVHHPPPAPPPPTEHRRRRLNQLSDNYSIYSPPFFRVFNLNFSIPSPAARAWACCIDPMVVITLTALAAAMMIELKGRPSCARADWYSRIGVTDWLTDWLTATGWIVGSLDGCSSVG